MTPKASRDFHARKARTRLNLAITNLEAASGEADNAGLRRQAGTLARLAREASELLPWFPLGYDQRETATADKRAGGGS